MDAGSNTFWGMCNVIGPQRHLEWRLCSFHTIWIAFSCLTWYFECEVFLENSILAKSRAQNYTVNPDWNSGKMQFLAKSAMRLFLCFEVVSIIIQGAYNNISPVPRFKFVARDNNMPKLYMWEWWKIWEISFSAILGHFWPKIAKNAIFQIFRPSHGLDMLL